MRWYVVTKTIKGRPYLYRQRTYREGGKVRTESHFICAAGEGEEFRGIGKALKPLAKEARKFKTAEEFVEKFSKSDAIKIKKSIAASDGVEPALSAMFISDKYINNTNVVDYVKSRIFTADIPIEKRDLLLKEIEKINKLEPLSAGNFMGSKIGIDVAGKRTTLKAGKDISTTEFRKMVDGLLKKFQLTDFFKREEGDQGQ